MSSYVVFGLPGSGKGTLSQFLQKNSDVTQVCSGDLLRAEAKQDTKLQEQLHKGTGIDESFVTRLVISRLEELCRAKKRFILDGFPQSEQQREALDKLLTNNPDLKVQFILIKVESETALQRMASRFSCIDCANIFNTQARPPKTNGICDDCQGTLKQRAADLGEAAIERLKVYEKNIKTIVDDYREKSNLIVFDGNQSLETSLRSYETLIQ